MDLIATIYDKAGTAIRSERVHLSVTQVDTIQIAHLRLGLEVSYISGTGQRIDYRAVDAEHRPSGWGSR
jgi:hypothetical protein